MAIHETPFKTPWRFTFCTGWSLLLLFFFFFSFLIEKVTAGWVCTNYCRAWIFSFMVVTVLLNKTFWVEPPKPILGCVLLCDIPSTRFTIVFILGLMSLTQLEQRLQEDLDFTCWFNAVSPDPGIAPNAKLTFKRFLHYPLSWLALWVNSAQRVTLCDFLQSQRHAKDLESLSVDIIR